MYPKLFELPVLGLPINSYGFMIMLGFLLATYIGVRRARALGISSDLILDIGIISMIFGIIGAKINYVLQYPSSFGDGLRIFDFSDGGMHWLGALLLGPVPFAFWYWRTRKEPQLQLYSWQNGVLLVLTLFFALVGTRAMHLALHRAEYDWTVFSSWQSGFVLYGGLITAVLFGMLYTKMRGESIARIADLAAPLILLGIAFGRVGCFLNGCCYGDVTTSFLGVAFPPESMPFRDHLTRTPPLISADAAHSLPVLPTQLFETAATLALFFGLSLYDRAWKKRPGETMLLAAMGYATWRFIVEFLRDDPRPPWLGSLSYSQTLSLINFIACGVWLFLKRTRPQPEAAPAPSAEEPAGSAKR